MKILHDTFNSSEICLTKSDKYSPSNNEAKILQAMLNPDNFGCSITELCRSASVSRDTYYTAMQKPGFLKLYKETALSIIKHEILPLIFIGIGEAKKGSFQHWKALMQMVDLIDSDSKTINNNALIVKFQDD